MSDAYETDPGSQTLADAIAEHANCAGTLDVGVVEGEPGAIYLSCPGCGAVVEHHLPVLGGADRPAPSPRSSEPAPAAASAAQSPEAPEGPTTDPPPSAPEAEAPAAVPFAGAFSTAGETKASPGVSPAGTTGSRPGARSRSSSRRRRAAPRRLSKPAWLAAPTGLRRPSLPDWTRRGSGPASPRHTAGRPLLRGLAAPLAVLAAFALVVLALIVLRDDGTENATPLGEGRGQEATAGDDAPGPSGGDRASQKEAGGSGVATGPESGQKSAEAREDDGGGASKGADKGGGASGNGSSAPAPALRATDVRGVVSIGLPSGWSQRGVEGGALVFASDAPGVRVRVWFDQDSDLSAREIARRAADSVIGAPGAQVRRVRGGAEVERDEGSTREIARALVDDGTRILGVATISSGADRDSRKAARATLRSLAAS